MWIVLVVLGAVILAAVVFSMDRSGSVVDQTTIEPAATESVPVEPETPETAPDGADTSSETGSEAPTGTGGSGTSP
jgi:hypothetical protein